MSQRTVIVLAAALAVLLALVLFGQRRGTTTPSQSGAELLPNLEAALGDIERVTIVKANGETVATLEKRPEDWVVADKHGYPANTTKLRQALTALAEAKIVEQKTANPELYDRLGVEDVSGADAAGLSVAFTAPGVTLPTVILGNAEGSSYRYARRADEAQSYLIDRNPDVPRTAARWVESQIIDVRGDRVREVTITHPDGEIVHISKDSPELANFTVADIPEGRELSYPGVANVIGNALRELNLEDVEPKPEAAPENATIVSVPILTIYFSAMAVFGGYFALFAIDSQSLSEWQSGALMALSPFDIPLVLTKTLGLGALIGWLCSYYGLDVGVSPTEVPQKASKAVVQTLMACIIYNAIITILFYGVIASVSLIG